LYDEGESPVEEITFDYDDGTSVDNSVVKATALIGNYPNPFNPTTTISFQLAGTSQVELSIFNIKGQLVNTLVNEQMNSGVYNIEWNGKDMAGEAVSSGFYFYKLNTNRYSSTKKMILLK